MDAKRLPLPFLSRPVRVGQPYHGLLIDGKLTLSTGAQIDWPGAPYGDCYRFQVPGVPALEMTPAEVVAEASLGREWRTTALLTGHMRNYAGIVVGSNAWLYGAPDGTVWRIECDRLDNPIAAIEPALGRGRPWPFPATLDFTFKIRRFGVVSPDSPLGNDAPITTRVVAGQSLGGAWMSDYVPLDGTYVGSDRRNVWIAGIPHLAINIEDISSTGGQAIFGVNRTSDQAALEGTAGRASPYAWLLVTVSGDEASGITVGMSVREVVDYVVDDQEIGSDVVGSDYWGRDEDGSVRLGPAPVWATPDAQTYTRTASHGPITVGLFFAADDSIRRVRTSGWTASSVENGYQRINSEGVTDFYIWTYDSEVSPVSVVMEGAGGVSFPAISMHADRTITGGSFSITGSALGGISSADGGQNWLTPGAMWSGTSASRWPRIVSTVKAFGPGKIFSAFTWWRNGGVLARDFDGLVAVRVTNKVYAVIASRDTDNSITPNIPGAFKVLAIGSPAGWVTGSAIEAHWKASYNPITNQLATCEASHSRGWV